jgi:hypothetical protein
MSEANMFFRGFKQGLKGELFTSAIAQIETYDPLLSKADIILLPGGDLIKSVPVGMPQTQEFYIRIPYQKGDHVLVVFSKTDIDPIMYDNGKIPSERMLAMDDAIVVCGINLFTEKLPAADADKLVIGQTDGLASMTMGEGKIIFSGEVEFKGATKLNGGTTVNGTALSPGGEGF